MQVTLPPPAIVMLTFFCVVDEAGVVLVPVPVDVQEKLLNLNPAGSAPSVTVYVPAGTLVQVWVLAELSALPLFPLSFSENAVGVSAGGPAVVCVQLSCEPDSVDVNPNSWFNPRGFVRFLITTVPQLVRLKLAGPTRSF